MIKPYNQGQSLADEIADAKKNGHENAFDIWWLGQSGFLVQWNKKLLLLDPYLSDSLTKKYSTTDKPHTRLSEIVIDPSLLVGIDIVTSSHHHTDHLDAETLRPILKNNPNVTFIIPEAHRKLSAERADCGFRFPLGMSSGEEVYSKGFKFIGIPSAHNEIEYDADGNCVFMGYVIQFGKWSLYHSGDTLWHPGLVDLLKPFQVDVAFHPINGNLPERRVAGNLNTKEAAMLGKEIGAKLVIPHHYDLFEFNTADPKEFERYAENLKQPFKVLRLGERVSFSRKRMG
jgi:L-ascorbate metabolism protein UlaG (beta-lactamase superfamily)